MSARGSISNENVSACQASGLVKTREDDKHSVLTLIKMPSCLGAFLAMQSLPIIPLALRRAINE
jgi:hypothetical protein